MEGFLSSNQVSSKHRLSPKKSTASSTHLSNKPNQVGTVMLYGIPIVSLVIESQERLCLAQISNTLLKQYSYNEIHNRRVALGITCVQCTPVQLEILRRAGAMPVSSRRCGMITRREAERLCKSFLGDNAPPRLPDDFAFSVHHECAWGCRGAFLPSRYNSSRAKCIKCTFCGLFFSPNKFIFHSHRTTHNATYVQPDAANFNSWRRHMKLSGSPPDDVVHAWEDVKAMFNGGTRKRLLSSASGNSALPIRSSIASVPIASASPKSNKLDISGPANSSYPTPMSTTLSVPTSQRVPPFPDLSLPISMMDYVWHSGVSGDGMKQFPFAPYAVPWFGNTKRSVLGLSSLSSVSPQQESLLQHLCSPNNSEKIYHHSAFRPVFPTFNLPEVLMSPNVSNSIIKRRSVSDELLLPKKKYSIEIEKLESSSNELIGSENEAAHPRCESSGKENSLQKGLATANNSYSDIICQNNILKMSLKKESSSERSNESDETTIHDATNLRERPEIQEPADMSKLLAFNSPLLSDETVFRFREFSPNLLETVSHIKTEEHEGAYSGLTVRIYPGVNSDKETSVGECCKKAIEEGNVVEEDYKDAPQDGKDEDGDNDEPVDVETMEDLPLGPSSASNAQENSEDGKEIGTRKEEKGRAKTNRIWTIARFSLGEPHGNSGEVQPSGLNSSQYNRNHGKEDSLRETVSETKKQMVDCLGCCQIAFSNG